MSIGFGSGDSFSLSGLPSLLSGNSLSLSLLLLQSSFLGQKKSSFFSLFSTNSGGLICDAFVFGNLSCPLVGNLHSVDEWIDIDSMGTFYKIYEQYIEQKCPSKKTS